ncbi:MAG TPA: glycosyltransferase family 39 protein [bacterium]|nr:glycosyltransferase family 39 protein [bacterium]
MANSPANAIPFFIALFLAALGQAALALGPSFLGLCVGLLGYAAALATLSHASSEPKAAPAIPLRWEVLGFLLVLGLAFFFRVFRIDSVPAGMHTDQGLTGVCALRILHEGWRPFGEVFDYEVPEVLLFYQLAGWFGLAGSSLFSFHLFFILLSLTSFPFIYWTVRQWAGPRTALLSLFVLAVMRWNWTMTRNGYPSIQVPFYLFGALAFWTYGLRRDKRWAFYLSALFVGAGFYTYQAFKIVPFLMLAYAADEWLHQKKRDPQPFLRYFLLVLILCAPLLAVMAQKKQLGFREKALFLGTALVEERSLKPLGDVWAGTALMFNRAGDPNPRHNIPDRRMLDDVTGVLFILGLGLAWRRRREPGFFYPLAGAGAMLLTNLLTTDPAHANRLVSLTPFVAFFAGVMLDRTFEAAGALFKKPSVPALLLANLMALMTAQNVHTYFVRQARDPACLDAFGPAQNFIGQSILKAERNAPGRDRYFIPSSFYGNHTVAFLTYPMKDAVHPFHLADWISGKAPTERPSLLFLEGGKKGVVDLLEMVHPGLSAAPYRDSAGHALLYIGYIQPAGPKGPVPWTRGLQGVYFNGADWKGKPTAIQRDPLLNFTSKFDFPFTQGPPFRVRWTGELRIDQAGDYQFQALATDQVRLWLDGKAVQGGQGTRLGKGSHSLRLELEKDSGDQLALTLIWKRPGTDKWQVVPATAFGKVPLRVSSR